MKREAAMRAAKVAVDRDRAISAVSSWNLDVHSGRKPASYPTIGGAIAAGTPWLSYMCPGCRQVGDVDLRTLDIHERAPISAVIQKLRCGCSDNPPFVKLLELREARVEVTRRTDRRA